MLLPARVSEHMLTTTFIDRLLLVPPDGTIYWSALLYVQKMHWRHRWETAMSRGTAVIFVRGLDGRTVPLGHRADRIRHGSRSSGQQRSRCRRSSVDLLPIASHQAGNAGKVSTAWSCSRVSAQSLHGRVAQPRRSSSPDDPDLTLNHICPTLTSAGVTSDRGSALQRASPHICHCSARHMPYHSRDCSITDREYLR
nr:hypothetical protein CFP56_54995 [Quercus suber]